MTARRCDACARLESRLFTAEGSVLLLSDRLRDTAHAIRALVRDTTRPLRDRLADLEALAGRLEGEDG